MLHLWIATDRKVNTEKAFSLLREQWNGERDTQILMVPEQFSHITQQAFCEFAGDRASRMAQVLDFTRLAEQVFSELGGVAEQRTDRAGQLMMMALAVEQVRTRLKLYGNGTLRPEFLLQLLEVFDEFSSYCVTPGSLRKVAAQLEGVLALKAEEFALLMESYAAVCENCGQNPDSRLNRLYDRLQESSFGEGKQFYFDGFTDFNGIQKKILGVLLRQGAQLHVFLTCDGLDRGDQQFDAARETAKMLQGLCRQHQVQWSSTYLTGSAQKPSLAYLRKHLFTGRGSAFGEAQEELAFLTGSDALAQCRCAAGEILRLVEQGARWRDMTVVCPDLGVYEPVLRSVFRRSEIPAYFAGDRDLLRQPAVHMLLAALEAAGEGMEQDAVLTYLKSGFSPLEREESDRIENYILLWNLRGNRFSTPWELHPGGLELQMTPEDEERLAALNESRHRALTPLCVMGKALREAKNTGEMVLALYEFTEAIELQERLEQFGADRSREGELQRAQEAAQLYELLCGLLEQMYGVLGSSKRSVEDFIAMFRTALSQCTVGTIPASLDCVNVGSLMSQRRSDTPYVFLLGADEGSFPGTQNNTSLLTDQERSSLLQFGLGVSPTAAGRLERELAAMDSVLNAPTKCLYTGACEGREAYLVKRMKLLFPRGVQLQGDEALRCRAKREYLGALTRKRACRGEDAALEAQAEALREAAAYGLQALEPSGVRALYGKELRLSSSQIDTLASCRLAYFLNYGLRAKERKSAQMDPSLYGTFVHDVLEHTAKQVMAEGGFRQVTAERTVEIAVERMEHYAETELAELWQSPRAEYLFRRNFEEVKLVVQELYRELSVSSFAPTWFELDFSFKGAMPAVRIVGEETVAHLAGYVDRVDLWQQGDKTYVRVVDYKTGKKSLEYTKLFYGLGLQMLLYLFALEQNGEALGKGPLTPAGVLYFPARIEKVSLKDRLQEAVIEEERRKKQKRSGLLLKDSEVLQGMEPCQEDPYYLPYRYDKNGQMQGDLADGAQMKALAEFVLHKVALLADELYSGEIAANPYSCGSEDHACTWCPYTEVCRENRQERRLDKIKKPEEFWQRIKEESGDA